MPATRSTVAGAATGQSIGCGGTSGASAAFGCDVLGQFEVHRSRPLFARNPERIAHQGRNRGGGDDLPRHLGERTHGAHDVDDLEAPLAGALDRFLAGEHQHGHRAEVRIRGAGGEVESARPQGRQTHAGPARQAALRRGHEGGGLLMAREDEIDPRFAKRLDHVEVFLARNAENPLDSFVLERAHEKIGSF